MKKHFDVNRFWWLLRLELFKARKGLVLTLVITVGMLFFFGMLLQILVENNRVYESHASNYAFSLLIGGYILTSLAFNDLGNALKRNSYLTLPVSTFERVLCMWLLTSVGWILLFTIEYTIYSLLANPVGKMLFNFVTFKSFDPFGPVPLTTMIYYTVTQGIFLMGAAYFRGYVFPKTVFTLVLISFVSMTLIYFFLKDVFMSEHECMGFECELVDAAASHLVWEVIKVLFWWVLAPLTLVMSYLGIKEQES